MTSVCVYCASSDEIASRHLELAELDPDGHYAGLLAWLDELVAAGFASPVALERLVVTTDVDVALDACAA